ncbi:hypothetical protein [Chryseobacterium sp. 8AT]|uniref:hypothetical protein n=1 Tax=Chryseobacterium sp. 8AT TaxID=2653134 RepID=UPI0012F3387A|nr:hypothetical protein [Chryseobacterium sp. 8AT]VXB03710.1 conserved hypothetical protein [Chryseobacterium sp. 8AT]
MKEKKINLSKMRADAYWAYLEFCEATSEVPRKEIYNQIKTCSDDQALDRITIWIENNHSKFEKMMLQNAEVKKKSFLSRIFKF